MKVLCEHENQKLKIFIVNYYFYFQNETIRIENNFYA